MPWDAKKRCDPAEVPSARERAPRKTEIAAQIIERDGDYVLSRKGNQGNID